MSTAYQRAKRAATLRAVLCAASLFILVTVIGPSIG